MRQGRDRPAFALLLVLLVLAGSALVVTSAIMDADAQVPRARATLGATRARALAWSGVQAAMAEIGAQREALLAGGEPRLTRAWTVPLDDGGAEGVVRLVPPDGPSGAFDADGAAPLAVSESAKIDLNRATPEMLALLPGLGEDGAGIVVSGRAQRQWGSVQEVEAELGGSTRGELDAAPDAAAGGEAAADWRGLVTAYSADANVQSGVGGESSARGRRRIDLNVEWSERLERAVTDRFGADAAASLQRVMSAGASFKSSGDIVRALRQAGAEPRAWGVILDAFTTTSADFLLGRVDVNRAPREVLVCVPGVDEAAAEAIAAARDRLDEATRLDPAWPVMEGALTPEQFEQAADWLTTRSFQWRIRVEAGLASPEMDSGESGVGADPSAPLRDRVVYEAVIDASAIPVRVAYLRDVTYQDIADRLEQERAAAAAPVEGPETGDAMPSGTSGDAGDSAALEWQAEPDDHAAGEEEVDDGTDSGADAAPGESESEPDSGASIREPPEAHGGRTGEDGERAQPESDRAGSGGSMNSGAGGSRRPGRWAPGAGAGGR